MKISSNKSRFLCFVIILLYSALIAVLIGAIIDLRHVNRGQFAYAEGVYDSRFSMINLPGNMISAPTLPVPIDQKRTDDAFMQHLESNQTIQGRIVTRGYYWHHYASWASSSDGNLLETIAGGFMDQYGWLGTAPVRISNLFSLSLTPVDFASLSISMLAAAPFLAVAVIWLCGVRDHWSIFLALTFSAIITLFYSLLLNTDQLVVSPGFSSIRYVAPSGIAAAFFIDKDIYWRRNPRRALVNTSLLLSVTLALLNGPEFNLIIGVFGVVGIAPGLFKYARNWGRVKGIYAFLPYFLEYRSCSITFSCLLIGLTQNLLKIGAGGRILAGSAAEGNMNISAYLTFILGLLLWAVASEVSTSVPSYAVNKICSLMPFLGISLYSFAFWGSPNHAAAILLIGLPVLSLCMAQAAQGLISDAS
jgi:hypothetical protein